MSSSVMITLIIVCGCILALGLMMGTLGLLAKQAQKDQERKAEKQDAGVRHFLDAMGKDGK